MTETLAVIFTVIGILNTVGMFAVGMVMRSWQRTIDQLREEDKDQDRRIRAVEKSSAESGVFREAINKSLTEATEALKRLERYQVSAKDVSKIEETVKQLEGVVTKGFEDSRMAFLKLHERYDLPLKKAAS